MEIRSKYNANLCLFLLTLNIILPQLGQNTAVRGKLVFPMVFFPLLGKQLQDFVNSRQAAETEGLTCHFAVTEISCFNPMIDIHVYRIYFSS